MFADGSGNRKDVDVGNNNDNSNPQQGPRSVSSPPGSVSGNRNPYKIPATQKDSRKIFVGGVPGNLTNLEFRQYFEQHGTIVDSVVMIDRDTNRSRGFGFVTFKKVSDAQALLGGPDSCHNMIKIKGKTCEIKLSEPKKTSSCIKGKERSGTGERGRTVRSNQPRHIDNNDCQVEKSVTDDPPKTSAGETASAHDYCRMDNGYFQYPAPQEYINYNPPYHHPYMCHQQHYPQYQSIPHIFTPPVPERNSYCVNEAHHFPMTYLPFQPMFSMPPPPQYFVEAPCFSPSYNEEIYPPSQQDAVYGITPTHHVPDMMIPYAMMMAPTSYHVPRPSQNNDTSSPRQKLEDSYAGDDTPSVSTNSCH